MAKDYNEWRKERREAEELERKTRIFKRGAIAVLSLTMAYVVGDYVFDEFISKENDSLIVQDSIVYEIPKDTLVHKVTNEEELDNYSTTIKVTYTNNISSDSLTCKILKYMENLNRDVITLEDDAQKIEIEKIINNRATGLRYTLMPKENLEHPDLLHKFMTILTDYQRDGQIDSALEYIVNENSREKQCFISENATKNSELAEAMGISNVEKSEQYQKLGLDIRKKCVELAYNKL